MLPVNYGGHAACQDTFVSAFLELFPDPFAVPKQTWDIIVKFWYLDLSETDIIMQEFYSLLGKPATRFPSFLLRSYLLSIALKVDSITGWCRLLKITPLYAIPSGKMWYCRLYAIMILKPLMHGKCQPVLMPFYIYTD